jgi:hypothetical protein
MPFYRFQIATPLAVEAAVEGIRAITRDPPTFRESLRLTFLGADSGGRPFHGTVRGHAFRLRRDIRGRNLFLPMIRGSVRAGPAGTEVSVTMFVDPLAAVLVILWLSAVGLGAWTALRSARSIGDSLAGLGLFIAGIAVALGGFILAARKARRLLEEALRAR